MQNLFVGYCEDGILYGCKDYISNEKEELKADEMMKNFFMNYTIEQIKDKLKGIYWENVDEYYKANNGFPLMIFLSEKTTESYARHEQSVMQKISSKTEPLYDTDSFKEKNGKMLVRLRNYGHFFENYEFNWIYIIDIDNDTLTIENRKEKTKEKIKRT